MARSIQYLVLAGMAVGSLATFSASSAQAAVLELINASPATIEHFYVTPCRKRTWGADLTGTRAVPPGGTFTIDLPHGCYDLKVTTARGKDCTIANARLRGVKTWTITRSHLRLCS